VQGQLTHERREAERLEALLIAAKAAWGQDESDIADLTHQLDHLKNDTAQHEFELNYWVSRLELFQPAN
jgi:hypothetical protein